MPNPLNMKTEYAADKAVHELKTWPKFFAKIMDGTKPFEIRKNDRNFQVSDELFLREWNPETGQYTGRSLRRTVSYIYPADGYGDGVHNGYCVLGLQHAADKAQGEWTVERLRAYFSFVGLTWQHEFANLAKDINASIGHRLPSGSSIERALSTPE